MFAVAEMRDGQQMCYVAGDTDAYRVAGVVSARVAEIIRTHEQQQNEIPEDGEIV